MKFSIQSYPDHETDLLIFGFYQNQQATQAMKTWDKKTQGYLSQVLKKSGIQGKIGQSLYIPQIPDMKPSILLIGCGNKKKCQHSQYQQILSYTIQQLKTFSIKKVVCYLTKLKVADIAWRIKQATLISQQQCYRFEEFKSEKQAPIAIEHLTWMVRKKEQRNAENALKQGQAIALGSELTQDLANRPGNHCTPSDLAEQAQQFAHNYTKIKTTILAQDEIEKLGMGAFLSVAKGSRQPPKLIVMEYNLQAQTQPIVLVGKGITFDAGGISLKSPSKMDEMKYDMAGAATIFGAMLAVAELQLPLSIVAVIASAENLPDGNASKPGDIVKSMSGKTIEILNTDAEGRLVLCDALSYVERYQPKVVIDLATLTGACIVALGDKSCAILGNNDNLIQQLLKSSNTTLDRAWQLPLWPEHRQQLESNFADFANIGGSAAGTITAAAFLSHFTENYAWAHMDIAGVAWRQGKDKGATARPLTLLMDYLINQVEK